MRELDYTDFLLFDYVSEFKLPLDLVAQPKVNTILNMPHHYLSKVALIEHLYKLKQDGFLTITFLDSKEDASFKAISKVVEKVHDGGWAGYSWDLPNELQIEVSLTSQGGEVWEHVFKPDWNKYCDHSIGSEQIGKDYYEDWTLTQVDLGLLERLLNLKKKYLFIENIEIQKIENWQVNYWKVLPKAYQAKFMVKNNDGFWIANLLSPEDRKIYDNLLYTWKKYLIYPYKKHWQYPLSANLILVPFRQIFDCEKI